MVRQAGVGMWVGSFILVSLVLVAIFAPFVSPHDPFTQELVKGLESPAHGHLLGRDVLGRDLLSRLIYGARGSLVVGMTVVGISLAIGLAVGGLSGIFGGLVDLFVMRCVEIAQAFPGLLLAISIMAVMGPGFGNLLFALCLTGWTGFARLARGQIVSLREREFISAALASGAGKGRLLFFHYLPNMTAPLMVEAVFAVSSAVLAEAGLGFLGLGIQPPAPSWGSMLNEGRPFLLIAPYLTIFPGLSLLLLVVAVNLVGNRIREKISGR